MVVMVEGEEVEVDANAGGGEERDVGCKCQCRRCRWDVGNEGDTSEKIRLPSLP